MTRNGTISTQNQDGTKPSSFGPSDELVGSSLTSIEAFSTPLRWDGQAGLSEISVTLAGERIARLDAIVHRRWLALHEISGSADLTAGAVSDIPATAQEGSATGAEVAAAVGQPSATVAESSAVIPPAGVTVAASPAKTGQFRGGIPSRPMTRFSEVLQRRGRKVPFPALNPVPAP